MIIRLGDAMEIWYQAQSIRFDPANREKFQGANTGILSLDLIGPVYHPFYGVVVARNKAGKTAFMLTMALNFAKQGYAIYYDPLEMTVFQMCTRTAANTSITDMDSFNKFKANDMDWYRVGEAITMLHKYDFFLARRPARTPMEIDKDIEEVKAACPGKRVVALIDYVSLMKYPGMKDKTREIEAISTWMKSKTITDDLQADLTPEAMLNMGNQNTVSIVTASQIPGSIKRADEKITIDSAMYSSVFGNDCDDWWVINDIKDANNNKLPTLKEIEHAGRNIAGGAANVQFNRAQARYEDYTTKTETNEAVVV